MNQPKIINGERLRKREAARAYTPQKYLKRTLLDNTVRRLTKKFGYGFDLPHNEQNKVLKNMQM